jgi:hypothetical protein
MRRNLLDGSIEVEGGVLRGIDSDVVGPGKKQRVGIRDVQTMMHKLTTAPPTSSGVSMCVFVLVKQVN